MSHRTNKRKFVLPSFTDFQHKLEDFYVTVTKPRVKQTEDYAAYITLICEYRQKGMTLREIAAATGISLHTTEYWLRKKGLSKKLVKKNSEVAPNA